ncbi:NAD(P)H-hydrate epimerase [Fopius arisanus]|uniref:NAD(P)H-hydrate epimerase n=1 Tax=Fopius arisanus TaxID=64838 RepID=A0A9R1U2P5_9HYME|nr:PREDICTED: NAD(P)H-hydrate epimerase [Fopius arisanus]
MIRTISKTCSNPWGPTNLSLHRAITGSSWKMVKYLNQKEAIKVDEDLFKSYRFSVDQLMELAGQACAIAITKTYPPSKAIPNPVLICCGPGNNGGDGLVCARHLKLFGYDPEVYYPKKTTNKLYENLMHQCTQNGVTVHDKMADIKDSKEFKVIVDALFGFSFKPPVREEFVPIIEYLKRAERPICSVDIPSGWDVEAGPPEDEGIKPEMLISLTAPKLCAKKFKGIHFLGGRFVPKNLEVECGLKLPEYLGTELVVLL